jgi:hypothetical protein
LRPRYVRVAPPAHARRTQGTRRCGARDATRPCPGRKSAVPRTQLGRARAATRPWVSGRGGGRLPRPST